MRGGSDEISDGLVAGKAGCGQEQVITRRMWSQIFVVTMMMIEYTTQIC